jgi:hypothetical protein
MRERAATRHALHSRSDSVISSSIEVACFACAVAFS